MNSTGWLKRVLIATKLTTTRLLKLIQRLVPPFKRYILDSIFQSCRIIRPTLFLVLRANNTIAKLPKLDADQEATKWQAKLYNCTYKEREYAVNTLFSLFESDQNRTRGVESKARGVMQTAGLVIFAGDAVVLNLALREESSWPAVVIGLIAVSGVYLLAALVASHYVEKPGQRHVLNPDNVLPLELAGSELAVAIKLNRRDSIARTNLTESAIFDVARALVTVALALVTALLTI